MSNFKIKFILLIFFLCIQEIALFSQETDKKQPTGFPYSVGGFYQSSLGNRKVYGFNQGWRFYKGDIANEAAALTNFDDKNWEIVNTPHAIEILNRNASGGANYQGVVWYRKHFTMPKQGENTRSCLYFEAIMGKCKIYINGKLAKEHVGGYIPFLVDLTGLVNITGTNLIAVSADNSNDPTYPPGLIQEMLDFCYFGGIYRDVWLTTMSQVHVSDANDVNVKAGGGVFVHYSNLSKKQATVNVETHVLNQSESTQSLTIETQIIDKAQNIVAKSKAQALTLNANGSQTLATEITVKNPALWTPETPYLYWVEILIKNKKQEVVDAVRVRTGIRTIAMDAERGFILNGEEYPYKLMGANRHQDYGYIGNAMTNNLHYRDARKFKEMGLRSIRSAHYPQDPAFMDACDELGLLVIVATPGWQFWNNNPIFGERVYQDIRNMIRRDRNHPSVLMWECILNETRYPESFAKEAHRICHEEYPYPGCYTACDAESLGKEAMDVLFAQKTIPGKPTFTREYSSNVDDFTAQNSDDRISRSYGEKALVTQAYHQLDNSYLGYSYTDYAKQIHMDRSFIGGTLWPGIEYNRGYRPKPQYGGVMDIFRYPKMSYYTMQSQREPNILLDSIASGPSVYIANLLTTFSDQNITVFSNCEQVRLLVNGNEVGVKKVVDPKARLKYPPVTFENAFTFMRDWKPLFRKKQPELVQIEAEGLIGGKVVVRDVRRPAQIRDSIFVWSDNGKGVIYADGSTVIPVFAKMVDKSGNHLVLDDQTLELDIDGPGEIIEGGTSEANPVKPEFGIAPILVRVGSEPGKITLHVRNYVKRSIMPKEGVLTIETKALPWNEIAEEKRIPSKVNGSPTGNTNVKVLGKDFIEKIEKASKQQQDFDPSLKK